MLAAHQRLTALLLACLLFGALQPHCAYRPIAIPTPSPVDRLQRELDDLFFSPEFGNARWGVLIQSVKSGRQIYALDQHKNFMPASNMKLFTTAAALMELGPDFRFTTSFYATGPVADSTLDGDLVVYGRGDPVIGGRYTDGDITAYMRSWADSLRAHGISRISGRIVGDDSFMHSAIMGRGWAWEYQADWYAAQISALSFNDNCIDIILSPSDSVGKRASYRLEPDTKYARVDCQVQTVKHGQAEGVHFQRPRATNDVTVSGSIELGGKPARDWFTVEDPARFLARVLRETLIDRGIEVEGDAVHLACLVDSGDPPDLLFEHNSEPLLRILTTINKVSQNLYAELVLRALGKHRGEDGSADTAIEEVKQILRSAGIEPDQWAMEDGSGLSRYNMVTPRQVVALLRYMRLGRHGQLFFDTLPVAGEDGSLKYRMRGTAGQGNVHAKTGSLGWVRTLSGYVTTRDGDELAFSMMANNHLVGSARVDATVNLACARLADFSRQ